MEKNNEIILQKDELGIMTINVRKMVYRDIKNACMLLAKRFDLNDDKTRKMFDDIISVDPELIRAIKEEAFYAYARNIANGCPDFHFKEFLVWNYNLDARTPSEHLETIVSFVNDLVSGAKWDELKVLEDKWSKCYETISADCHRMDMRNLASKEYIFFIDEDEFELEDGPEKPKLEERLDSLKENLDDIEDFLDNPYDFDKEGSIAQAERRINLTLIRYIIDNALTWGQSGLLARIQDDIKKSPAISITIKLWFLDSLEEYMQSQKRVREKPSR